MGLPESDKKKSDCDSTRTTTLVTLTRASNENHVTLSFKVFH